MQWTKSKRTLSLTFITQVEYVSTAQLILLYERCRIVMKAIPSANSCKDLTIKIF